MTLFEINEAIAKAIENAIDPETGEITDFSELEALAVSRDEKIKNTALYILNIRAEAQALAEQEKKFKERKQVLLNREKRIFERLQFDLKGEDFKSTEVNISYRKSKGVEITNDVDFELFAIDHTEYIKPFKIEADKTAIKEALAKGIAIPGCEIVEKQNMQIK
jgi:hypothetical protein